MAYCRCSLCEPCYICSPSGAASGAWVPLWLEWKSAEEEAFCDFHYEPLPMPNTQSLNSMAVRSRPIVLSSGLNPWIRVQTII